MSATTCRACGGWVGSDVQHVCAPRVTRPVLRYHGGKWRLAPWIISHFPAHRVYVEPFGGAGSVLLQKPPAITEIWNDVEDEVVNLFSVLRDHADALARLLALTPFSRAEYCGLYERTDDPLERARRFVCRSFMGQSSKGALRRSGFDSRINPDGFASRLACLRSLPDELPYIAQRFADTIIECRPASDILAQYDRADALFYVDPPYLAQRANHYTHEMDAHAHAMLLEQLTRLTGMVALSGYHSPLYDDSLRHWWSAEKRAFADGARRRTEVLWLNPACAEALDRGRAQGVLPMGAA